MRLILSVEALTPSLSGIGRYTWELAQAMAARPEVEDLRYFRGGHWIDDPAVLLRAPTVPANRKRQIRPPRWARSIYWKYALRGQVFHGPNYMLPRHAENAVATVHDLSVFKFPETHPLARIKQFERDFADSMSRASQLITDSEAVRQEVIDYLAWDPARITSIPLGVSHTFAPRRTEDLAPLLRDYGLVAGSYTLCVSTVEPRKKIDRLLQAYQCLPHALRDRYPLVLVGAIGWLSESLHQEVSRLSQLGWLRYLGFVPEAALSFLYAGARAFVYPSTYEGFGLPVLEAMASGVPVVTSNRSCLPEVAQGAALLVDPDDIDALAVSVERCLTDNVWRDASIKQGLTNAQRHSWAQCMEETLKVYQRVAF